MDYNKKGAGERELIHAVLEKIDFILSRFIRHLPEEPDMRKSSAFLRDSESCCLKPVNSPVRVDLKALGGIDE